MTKEKKNEYTLRIAGANSTGLCVILYEMAITYIEDTLEAQKKGDNGEMKRNAESAMNCIEEMQKNLHYEYELAKNLNQIYLFMKKQIRFAIINGETKGLETVIKELMSLKNAYESIMECDKSKPVMSNTQAVLTGMTYGKDSVWDSLTTECGSRGYRV